MPRASKPSIVRSGGVAAIEKRSYTASDRPYEGNTNSSELVENFTCLVVYVTKLGFDVHARLGSRHLIHKRSSTQLARDSGKGEAYGP